MPKITVQWQEDSFLPFDAESVEFCQKLKENDKFLVNIKKLTKADQRTIDQNRLQFKWLRDAEKQGDMTASEYRAYCKLHFGVPLLRIQDEDFREIYDRLIRPLDYEDKLSLMVEPIDLPVTSRMSPKTMAQYLKDMSDHFIEQGFQLTGLEHVQRWFDEFMNEEHAA